MLLGRNLASSARRLLLVAVPGCSLVAPDEAELSRDWRCGAEQKRCDGTCVSARSARYGCGSEGCGPCELAHAEARCGNAGCEIAHCERWWGDCNGDVEDGCETDLARDPMNCGRCRLLCAAERFETSCDDGSCVNRGCTPPYESCGGAECDTDVETSREHCGRCRAPCLPANADGSCEEGVCRVATCHESFADCNSRYDDGCESDLTRDATHCGSCGWTCGTEERCVASGCIPRCHAIHPVHPQARVSVAPDGLSVGYDDFTAEVWFRTAAVEFKKGSLVRLNEVEGINDFALRVASTETECSMSNADGASELFGSAHPAGPPPVVGQWHHLACERSAGNLRLYFDGILRNEVRVDVEVVATSGLSIGMPQGLPRQFGSAAPPADVGPVRYSRVARYSVDFTPATAWPVDEHTILQYLTTRTFEPLGSPALFDETGRGHHGVHYGGFSALDANLLCD